MLLWAILLLGFDEIFDGVYFNDTETVVQLTNVGKMHYANGGTATLKSVYQWTS